jgi:hypothetical protein
VLLLCYSYKCPFKLFRLLYEDVINALWVQAFAPPGVIKKLAQE